MTGEIIETACIRYGHRHIVTIPDDPSTEIPCPDCGSRLAVVIEAAGE